MDPQTYAGLVAIDDDGALYDFRLHGLSLLRDRALNSLIGVLRRIILDWVPAKYVESHRANVLQRTLLRPLSAAHSGYGYFRTHSELKTFCATIDLVFTFDSVARCSKLHTAKMPVVVL